MVVVLLSLSSSQPFLINSSLNISSNIIIITTVFIISHCFVVVTFADELQIIVILFSAAMVLHLVNTNSRIEPWKLLVILNVNLTHVIVRALGWSGFNERSYEILRDLTLLVPDLFHVLVAYFELSIMAQNKGVSLKRLFYREEIMVSILMVALLVIFGNLTRL